MIAPPPPLDLDAVARTVSRGAVMPRKHRADAESVARLAIVRAKKSIDPNRPASEHIAFVSIAARRLVWQFAKREHGRDRRTVFPDGLTNSDGEPVGFDGIRPRPKSGRNIDDAERAARLLELLPRCIETDDEREIIAARLDGESVDEIAARLDVSSQTVRNRLDDVHERMRTAEWVGFVMTPEDESAILSARERREG